MTKVKQRVVIVGASPKPERYSNRAVALLIENGHEAIPVHPTATTIHGAHAVPHLSDVRDHVDTVTLYVSPTISSSLEKELLTLHPDRVIFNPDSENETLRRNLESHGIRTVEACTLVLLKTNQFDEA